MDPNDNKLKKSKSPESIPNKEKSNSDTKEIKIRYLGILDKNIERIKLSEEDLDIDVKSPKRESKKRGRPRKEEEYQSDEERREAILDSKRRWRHKNRDKCNKQTEELRKKRKEKIKQLIEKYGNEFGFKNKKSK